VADFRHFVFMLVDRANLLTLTAPEFAVLEPAADGFRNSLPRSCRP
jgi:catalase (peroxidase I)